MSDTTITNIPSALETRVKEPSDGTQVPPSGPGSSDRFSLTIICNQLALIVTIKVLKMSTIIIRGHQKKFLPN